MKATFFATAKEKFNTSFRKENSKCFLTTYKAIALKEDGRYFTAVDLRFYYTGTTMYCCFWYNDGFEIYGNATGKAGGYGYHKASAAFAEALMNSKFTIDEPISGRGDTAIEEAINAICEALKVNKVYLCRNYA